MANWCTTDVTVTGPKEQVEKLYKIMRELTERKDTTSSDGWGTSTWYGNLVTAFGGEWEKVYCRGHFYNLMYENGELSWSDEFAWREPYEVFDFLREKLPEIDIRFYAEEPGCDYLVTNIPDFAHFVSDFNCEWEYHDTLEELLAHARDTYGRDFASFEELAKFSEEQDECSVYEIEHIS